MSDPIVKDDSNTISAFLLSCSKAEYERARRQLLRKPDQSNDSRVRGKAFVDAAGRVALMVAPAEDQRTFVEALQIALDVFYARDYPEHNPYVVTIKAAMKRGVLVMRGDAAKETP